MPPGDSATEEGYEVEPILSSLADMAHPEHTALVVVDVQNDFCADGGFCSNAGDDLSMIQPMVPRLNAFIAKAREVKIPIVFVQAIFDEIYQSPPWLEKWARRPKALSNKRACLSNTWGADFYLVSPQPGDVVVAKHRYSAFVGTDLDLVLRSWGIKTLLISGVVTNVCVESTARDGHQLDYYIVLLEDCVAAGNEQLHETSLENIRRYFGIVSTTDDVLEAWRGSGT